MTEEAKQAELQRAWAAAVDVEDLQPGSVERALFKGWNIRVKFPEAFIAAYESIEAGMEVGAAITTHLNWPQAIVKSYNAAMSVLSALVESMEPLSYVTAAVLSRHKDGIEEAALRAEVDRFLDGESVGKFSWYLGTTASKMEEARADRGGDEKWIVATVRDLDKKQFLTRKDGKLYPRQKNVEWKIGV